MEHENKTLEVLTPGVQVKENGERGSKRKRRSEYWENEKVIFNRCGYHLSQGPWQVPVKLSTLGWYGSYDGDKWWVQGTGVLCCLSGLD